MGPFSAFQFPSHDISEVTGLQSRIRALRISIVRENDVSEDTMADFCACLKSREFYDLAKAQFPLIRNKADETLPEQDPYMARILEAAGPHIPAPYLPPVANTVHGLLAQKYALLMFDIVERGALGGRKIGPAMRNALCAGLKAVFEILGLTVSGNLAKYSDIELAIGGALLGQGGKTQTHSRAGAQSANVPTQTVTEALEQALQVGSLAQSDISKILVEMFQMIVGKDFDGSKAKLKLFWTELRKQQNVFQPGRQQDAEEFLTKFLGEVFGAVFMTAWGHRSVQTWRCTVCARSEDKDAEPDFVCRLLMEGTVDTTLVRLLQERVTKHQAFRKRCASADCQDQGQEGQVHSETVALQPGGAQELVLQVGRFRDASSAKNRALVSLPPWLFPVPGVNALYFIKAILVHEGRYINGGHYYLLKREGVAEAEDVQDAMDVAEEQEESGAQQGDGEEDKTLGLAAITIDEEHPVTSEMLKHRSMEDLKKQEVARKKRQAREKAEQRQREEAASFQLWKKYEDDKLTARLQWTDIQEQFRDWYLVLAVPASKQDLKSLAQRVDTNLRKAALDALSAIASAERQYRQAAARKSLAPVTALIQRHFELLGADLASSPVQPQHGGEHAETEKQVFLDFGFQTFANLGGGEVPPSSQDSASLQEMIQEEARDLLRDALIAVPDPRDRITPHQYAQHVLEHVFDRITDAIMKTPSNYIAHQTAARGRGTWDTFRSDGVATFVQTEQEAVKKRAHEQAEETKRATAEKERLERLQHLDMHEELAELLQGRTDEEAAKILDSFTRVMQRKQGVHQASGSETAASGADPGARKDTSGHGTDTTTGTEGNPRQQGSKATRGNIEYRGRDDVHAKNGHGADDNIRADEMNEDQASDPDNFFEASEAEIQLPSGIGASQRESFQTSDQATATSARPSATVAAPEVTMEEPLRPTSPLEKHKLFPPRTPRSKRAQTAGKPGPFSQATPPPKMVLGAAGGAGIQQSGVQGEAIVSTHPLPGPSQAHMPSPTAQAQSATGPIRSSGRPSSQVSPHPAGLPSVTETGSPLAPSAGRTLRRTSHLTGDVRGQVQSTHGRMSGTDAEKLQATSSEAEKSGNGRLPAHPEQDEPTTASEEGIKTALTYRPTPSRRTHPDPHERRESPYCRDRSIRRGSEGLSQHGESTSTSQVSQPLSVSGSDVHRTSTAPGGHLQGSLIHPATAGGPHSYRASGQNESGTLGRGLSSTFSAVRHPQRTFRNVRNRHSRSTLASDTFTALGTSSQQEGSGLRHALQTSLDNELDSVVDRLRRRSSQLLAHASAAVNPGTANDRPPAREGMEGAGHHVRRSLSAHNLLGRFGLRSSPTPRTSPQPTGGATQGTGNFPPTSGPAPAGTFSDDNRATLDPTTVHAGQGPHSFATSATGTGPSVVAGNVPATLVTAPTRPTAGHDSTTSSITSRGRLRHPKRLQVPTTARRTARDPYSLSESDQDDEDAGT